MLLQAAVGDAYGAGFEYVSADLVEKHNMLAYYVKHPRHNIMPGYYTDDTQMSLAIAELIVEQADWTPLNIASQFVEVFRRDPREGYAGRFYEFLRDIEDGQAFIEKIIPTSDKSGAAMRASPLGILADINDVKTKCRVQAAVTHNTPDGINAALASALMAHYFVYELGPKAELGSFVNSHVDGDWNQPWSGKVKSKGWMSVRAAITAVIRNDRMSTLLKDCVAFTGDVDTVATIALAAASCSKEYDQDLPESLVLQLENGVYGRDYLTQLDEQLFKLVG